MEQPFGAVNGLGAGVDDADGAGVGIPAGEVAGFEAVAEDADDAARIRSFAFGAAQVAAPLVEKLSGGGGGGPSKVVNSGKWCCEKAVSASLFLLTTRENMAVE